VPVQVDFQVVESCGLLGFELLADADNGVAVIPSEHATIRIIQDCGVCAVVLVVELVDEFDSLPKFLHEVLVMGFREV
jgi:hypothetical protein